VRRCDAGDVMRTRLSIAAAFALGGLVGLFAVLAGGRPGDDGTVPAAAHPGWAEMQWPFPVDQWGKGKAFRCTGTDCGVEITVYLRAKLGSCNCMTGVADDAELDRMSDFDLVGSEVTPLGPGRPISVAWMQGRSRAYALTGRTGRGGALCPSRSTTAATWSWAPPCCRTTGRTWRSHMSSHS
jgi:hypothetical protein